MPRARVISSRPVFAAALFLLATILTSSSAQAYCVYRTDSGNRLHWPAGPVIPNTINPAGADLVPIGPTIGAVNAGQFVWNGTPAPRWTFAIGGGGVGNPFDRDGTNLVGFHDLSEIGVSPSTYGVTLLWYVVGGPNDGTITEFGIALNTDPARTWTWSVAPVAATDVDIQSIAEHQLGHALGTAHTNVNGAGACAEGQFFFDPGPVMQPNFDPNPAVNPDGVNTVLKAADIASNNLPVVGEIGKSFRSKSLDIPWRIRRGNTTVSGNPITSATSYFIYPGACTDIGLGNWSPHSGPTGDSLNTYPVGGPGDYSAVDYSANAVGSLWAVRDGASIPTPDFCQPQKMDVNDHFFFGGDATSLMQVPGSNAAVVTCAIPVPAGTGTLTARWNQYLDLPRGSGYLPYVEYRFQKGGTWYEWRHVMPAEGQKAGSTRAWGSESGDLSEAAGAAFVQMRFGIECVPYLAANHINCSGTVNTGLLYDDLTLAATSGAGPPVISIFNGSLAQSTFVDGTMLGLNCTAVPCWPGIRGTMNGFPSAISDNVNSPLGDSMTVTITSPLGVDGNGINWSAGYDKTVALGMALVHFNPAFVPAFGPPKIVYRLFDPATKAWSPWDESELYADDVEIVAGVPIVHGSRYRWNWPPADKVALGALLPAGFTINGIAAYAALNFLPHGTRLQYVFKATDAGGGVTGTWQADTRPYEVVDLPTFPPAFPIGGVAPDILEFDVLPGVYPAGPAGSLLAGKTSTPVLNLDGAYSGWTSGQDPVTLALRGIGVRADRYRLLQGLGEGSNIGGHELSGQRIDTPSNYFPNLFEYPIMDSLAQWYRIIIQSGHLSGEWTVSDEQDSRLLREWAMRETGTERGDRCLFVTGDDFFDNLNNPIPGIPGPEQDALSGNIFGVASATGQWTGTTTNHYPVVNDRFADPAAGPALGAPGAYTYPLDGGCPVPNRFDALTAEVSPDAANTTTYPGGTEIGAVSRSSEFDVVPDHDRTKALGYGYTIEAIRKAGFPTTAPNYVHTGLEHRIQILYKFLTGCRGARSVSQTGLCWPCPSGSMPAGTALTDWGSDPVFQTATYGPLYPIQAVGLATAVKEEPAAAAPRADMLGQNRPNPFNPETKIPYSLSSSGHVVIEIYDVGGRRVRTLIDKFESAGPHTALWDGREQSGIQLSSGVYFYVIQYPNQARSSRKMTILR